jgi:rare lipoprotein A
MRALVTARRRGIWAIIAMLAILGAAVMTAAQSGEEGVANFYSDKFQGKKMASGELYDKDKLTASHKKLPYGSKVKVTNLDNGKSVVVTINDRMAP